MSFRLQIYPERPKSAVEEADPLERDEGCRRCPRGDGPKTVCMSAQGTGGGGLLVVGEAPGREEDLRGTPFVGASGRYLRGLVERHWRGPAVYDNALRCHGGEVADKHVAACRGYLAAVVRDVKPTRVLALGSTAMYSILGRRAAVFSMRRAYGWLANPGGDPIPVYIVIHPAATFRNRFVRGWFEVDLAWALKHEPGRPEHWGGAAIGIEDEDDALDAEAVMRAAPWIAFDCETAGKMFTDEFKVLAVSVTAAGSTEGYVWGMPALDDPKTRAPLARLLRDPEVKKIGQNVKYDELSVRCGLGVVARGVTADTRLWRKIEDAEADASLEVLAELVGMGGHKEEAEAIRDERRKAFRKAVMKGESLEEFGLPPALEVAMRLGADDIDDSVAYALMPRDPLYRYVAMDTISTAALAPILSERIRRSPEAERTWTKLVQPASLAFTQIEAWGIAASYDAIASYQSFLGVKVDAIRGRFAAYPSLNPASNPSVAKLLYEDLRLRAVNFSEKTGKPSTDADSLEAIKHQHPVVQDIMEWRRLTKLKGTYADGMLEHVRPDGRIHPSYLLDGARSGRPSCKQPNMLNIPRPETPEAKMARDVFIAPPGRILIQADYSQIELRVAAALSGDDVMRQIFVDGGDFHQRTAELIAPRLWGIKPEQVEKRHRSAAKAFNFGLLYGMGDETLASDIGCSVREAAQVRSSILGNFRALSRWIENQVREAHRSGGTWTYLDGERARWRPLWRIADEDSKARSTAEHGSYNSTVQGTAADYCLRSVTAMVNWLLSSGSDAKLVLTVYDSIMVEADEREADVIVEKLKEIMLSWRLERDVPLAVDFEKGRSWGSLESIFD